MFEHSIKVCGGIAISVGLFFAFSEDVEAWTPCMPICDYACTAPSAISMSMSALSSHLKLSKAILSNIDAIASLSSSMAERNATISLQETFSSRRRISAYDATTFKVSSSLQINATENDVDTNNQIVQHDVLSMNKKNNSIAKNATDLVGQSKNDSLLAALSASETINQNDDLMTEFLLASDLLQVDNNQQSATDEFREKLGLLADISHEIPNPFVTDDVDASFFIDYQKELLLLFNYQNGAPKNIYEAIGQVKNRLILNALNMDILQNVSFESNGHVESLTMQARYTNARAKAESYKRLMLEKDALISLDSQTNGSLLLTNVIIKSQKNMLLNEILKVKKQKNMLLALSMNSN